MALKTLIEPFVGLTLPLFAVGLWPFTIIYRLCARFREKKRVLLVARNRVAAEHLVDVREVLQKYFLVSQYITTDKINIPNFRPSHASNVVNVSPVGILRALLCHWDLVIFTNHPYGLGLCFAPWIKKIYVNHGIHSGKINNKYGHDGVYGESMVNRPFRKPYYDAMFASSHYEKDMAVRCNQKLTGRVRVTGFLKADKLIVSSKALRDEVRTEFGIGENDTVVHLISTWGKESLYARWGQWIFENIKASRVNSRYLLSIHPRFDDFESNCLYSREEILDRFESLGVIINSGLDWERYVCASDLVISDHSSLSLYHILLGHPLMLTDVYKDQYVEGSIFDLMRSRLPSLSDFDCLDDAVNFLELTRGKTDYSDFVEKLLSYRLQAESRFAEELSRALGMIPR